MSARRTAPVLANACGLSSPGTWTISALPGLKPSLRSYSATLIRCPAVLTGIAPAGRCTRRLVGDEGSERVKRLFGNGSRHGAFAYGWQSAAGTLAADAAGDTPRTVAAIVAAKVTVTALRAARAASILSP